MVGDSFQATTPSFSDNVAPVKDIYAVDYILRKTGEEDSLSEPSIDVLRDNVDVPKDLSPEIPLKEVDPAEDFVEDKKVEPEPVGQDDVNIEGDPDDDDHLINGWSLLPKLFEAWDFDESGSIDRTELLLGLDRYVSTKDIDFDVKKVIHMFHEVDINHDNSLDDREFAVFIRKFTDSYDIHMDDFAEFLLKDLEEERKMEQGWAMMPKLFKLWDFDANGDLDRREVMNGVELYCNETNSPLDRDRITEMFYEVDDNHDQLLDEREFAVFMTKLSDYLKEYLFNIAEVMIKILEEMYKIEEGWALIPRLFELFDYDNSCSIQTKEILPGLNLFCTTNDIEFNEKKAKAIFCEADLNGDGDLDLREFAVFLAKYSESIGVRLDKVAIAMVANMKKVQKMEDGWMLMPRLFEMWDCDESGSLDRGEVMRGLERYCRAKSIEMNYETVGDIFEATDDNHDGDLDQREFGLFMSKFAELLGVELDELAVSMLRHIPLSVRLQSTMKKFMKLLSGS